MEIKHSGLMFTWLEVFEVTGLFVFVYLFMSLHL